MATGSSLPPQAHDHELLRLLSRRIDGEPFPHSYIQEADAYSVPPDALVGDREHAPGTSQGDVKSIAWLICSPADCHPSAGGGSTPRRRRNVGDGAYWHAEARKKPVLGADGRTVVGYARALSYGHKADRDPPGTGASFKRLGWCMKELGLNHHDGDDQLVICKVYRSPRGPPAASPCDSNVTERRETTTLPSDYKCSLHPPAVLGVIRKPPPSTSTTRVAVVNKSDAGEKPTSSSAGSTGVVMKFGGSTIPSAERVKEIAELVLGFAAGVGCSPPVLVLSAMGNTTGNLLLAATKALTCGAQNASKIREFTLTKDLHLRIIAELGLDSTIASTPFDELERVLKGVATMKKLISKTRDYLVSFGEGMSARIFSAYLNKLGKGERQEWEPYDVHTCGRGCSDLTATTIARDFGSEKSKSFVFDPDHYACAVENVSKTFNLEILNKVWKDVNGVLTCDPTICANVKPLPYLTFDETAELGIFDAQSMQLAMEGGMRVTVKNSRNPQAPGTLITTTRDMSKVILTSIGLKSNMTMLNIKSRRMLGQSSFLAVSFSVLEKLDILFNCVSTSESKISLITVPSKTSSRELVQLELDNVVGELKEIAVVDRLENRSAISLIGNAQMSEIILKEASKVLSSINVKAQMISQVSSEVMKISLVVNDHEAEHCVLVLHSAFFGKGPIPSAAASSSGVKKRKAGGEHHPPGIRQERADTIADHSPSVIQRTALPGNDPIMPDIGGVPAELPDIILDDNHVPVDRVDNDGLAAAGVLPQPQAVQPEQPSGVDANHGAQEEYNRLSAFLDDDSPMPVRGDNGAGDPFRWFAGILEPDVLVNSGLAAEVLDVGDYPIDIPMLNAEAEQPGRLAEAAEDGSTLVSEEEEVIEALIAGATPDEFFGSPSSDMSWSPPALASSLHVAGECQAALCGLCITEKIGI